MKSILERYRDEGCRVVRSRGQNPNLLIIGEEHLRKTRVDPEELFEALKPPYFFCEGVRAGLEMDFTGYQKLHIEDSTPAERESFEQLVKDELFDLGSGFAGFAITRWFPKSPETKFVGMDLAGHVARNNRLVGIANKTVRKLDDYANDMLDLRSRELTDKQYKGYEVFRNLLYPVKNSTMLTVEEASKELEHIRKNTPRGIFRKSGTESMFEKFKQDAEREKTMARTMVDYVSGASGVNLAVVGALHIRRNSRIYPILDSSAVRYISIDITR
jgi:hypothetical protein